MNNISGEKKILQLDVPINLNKGFKIEDANVQERNLL